MNAVERLYDDHLIAVKKLQAECPHVVLSGPIGELSSDARSRTGRTIQACLECDKVVKFTTICRDCFSRSVGQHPFDDPSYYSKKNTDPKSTELDETTARRDPDRDYRGFLCEECLNNVPESYKDWIWTAEQQEHE